MKALAALLLVTLASCHMTPPPPAVVTVEIIVVPASGGMAQFSVNRDGTIKGGHLSGGDRPFVHQDDGRLDSATTAPLWTLVKKLQDSLPAEVAPNGKGYAMLQLDYEGGKSWQYSWPTAPHAPDPRVEAVSAWLLAHKIGGW